MKELFFSDDVEGKTLVAHRLAQAAFERKAIRLAIDTVLEADIEKEDLYRIAFTHGITHALTAIEKGDLTYLRKS